jgi:hypothetical protein
MTSGLFFEHQFYYSGSVMFVMILKDKSRHEVATEPQLEGGVWVATDSKGLKIKVPASQLSKIVETDDQPMSDDGRPHHVGPKFGGFA